jgi:hypothetical protein
MYRQVSFKHLRNGLTSAEFFSALSDFRVIAHARPGGQAESSVTYTPTQ